MHAVPSDALVFFGATRTYIIERGRICFGGSMSELDARPDIRDAHLSI